MLCVSSPLAICSTYCSEIIFATYYHENKREILTAFQVCMLYARGGEGLVIMVNYGGGLDKKEVFSWDVCEEGLGYTFLSNLSGQSKWWS